LIASESVVNIAHIRGFSMRATEARDTSPELE
jgi:hypothetical protein